MPVRVMCPNLRCCKVLIIPDDARGKMVKCQHCQSRFRVPEPRKPALGMADVVQPKAEVQ